MWYFSWILGIGLACSFAILNAMWLEMREDRLKSALPAPPSGVDLQ
ncbi:cytochrome bd-I oxidase subunit CydX [Rhizobium sp. PP-CC-3G-465]|nr:cyd operon protein YbgT [Rhizobium sp. PP-CC-3G-465]